MAGQAHFPQLERLQRYADEEYRHAYKTPDKKGVYWRRGGSRTRHDNYATPSEPVLGVDREIANTATTLADMPQGDE